jgi:hypothetical protein
MSSKGTSSETDKDGQKRQREAIATNAKGARRGGRKTYAERDPELVAAAKGLARHPVNGRLCCKTPVEATREP